MPITPIPTTPDARRLHGFTTPGGIIWRNLAVAGRLPWAERQAELIAGTEKMVARISLEHAEVGSTAAERGWVQSARTLADLPTARLAWTHPDSTPLEDILTAGVQAGVWKADEL